MAEKNKTIQTSFSFKLFLFFLLAILIFTIPVFFLVNHSLKNLGQFADSVNTRQIRQMANDFLAAMARDKAQKYDEIFLRIKTSATFLGLRAGEIYTAMDAGNPFDTALPPMVLNPDTPIFFTPESEPVITLFWGDQVISPAIQAELHALTEMDSYLILAKEKSIRALAAHIITLTGIGKYYTLNSEARQACFALPDPAVFDIRNGEPMTTFTRQARPDFQPRWTRLYKDDVAEGLMMTAVAPILDAQGGFRGITGIDIPLTGLTRDLNMKDPVMAAPDGRPVDYFAFLMDDQGRLVSFPLSHLSLFGLDVDLHQFKYSDDILTLNLADSTLPAVTHTAQSILEDYASRIVLHLGGQDYVLASHRLSQTGWHIVLVSSENQLLKSVLQTRQAFNDNLSNVLKSFLIYTGGLLLLIMGCMYLAVRWFIRPIQQLTRLTRKISNEDYSEKAQENSSDEIGELSRAFNRMIHRLQLSQEREAAHIEALSQRTEELRKLNEHLVYSEEDERKALASDLHDSVAQTLAMGISRTKDLIESDRPPQPEKIHEIQSILEQSVRQIRAMIYQLSPPILNDFDIDIAMGVLVEETNAREGTAFSYINHVTESIPLNHALKITLYRALDELLSNIRKHAGTKEARIQLWISRHDICLQVSDQGAGMDVQKLRPMQDGGFGLYSLSERIQNFGGVMEISSEPGKGTQITLTAPVKPLEKPLP
ncbi:MAG TPA: ATP-binding protein [Desulfotignum sp.]|nr:ATP-binding protein [Desulfotignum sp.]